MAWAIQINNLCFCGNGGCVVLYISPTRVAMPARENRKGYFAYMLSFYSDVGGATLCATRRRVGSEGINGGSDGLESDEIPRGVVEDFSDGRSQLDDGVDWDYLS